MAKRRSSRIVLDTNWYVSASINRKSRRTLYEILIDQRFDILYTGRLQTIGQFEETKIVTMAEFRQIIATILK